MGHDGNGVQCIQEDVIQEMRVTMRGFEALAPNLDALLPEIAGLRVSLDAHGRLLVHLTDRLGQVEKDAAALSEWKEDSKVQTIDTLKKALSDKVDAEKSSKGDRRRALLTLVVTVLAGLLMLAAGRLSNHVSWTATPAQAAPGR
jgi:hypothetical protein